MLDPLSIMSFLLCHWAKKPRFAKTLKSVVSSSATGLDSHRTRQAYDSKELQRLCVKSALHHADQFRHGCWCSLNIVWNQENSSSSMVKASQGRKWRDLWLGFLTWYRMLRPRSPLRARSVTSPWGNTSRKDVPVRRPAMHLGSYLPTVSHLTAGRRLLVGSYQQGDHPLASRPWNPYLHRLLQKKCALIWAAVHAFGTKAFPLWTQKFGFEAW